MTNFDLPFYATKIRTKLHFRVIILCLFLLPTIGFANGLGAVDAELPCCNFSALLADSIAKSATDTTQVADSVANKERKSAIDAPVYSTAKDSTIYALDNVNVVYLYGDAEVKYQNLELKAAYIEFDAVTKQAYAKGMPDSTGKIVGLPVFKEGDQSYEMDEIVYNFDSKRARITGVITEQEGGYLHGETVKKMEDDVFHLKGGRYTTCDHKHPHFSLHITKGKLIPNDKIVSGYAYLEILDVPIKFPGLPFGFFPITHKRAAGIIMPEYRDEDRRGLGLAGGGFYFGVGEYFDEKIIVDVFSRGSWGVHSTTTYRKRYKYSGSVGLQYSKYVTGEKGTPSYSESPSFSLTWNHSQDSKANPTSSFSASVNITSSNYTQYNATSVSQAVQNTTTSSVSYSKNWPGTPFSLSASLRHSLQTRDSTVSMQLPQLSFNMSSIYPFKRKIATGPQRWYERISIAWRSNLSNSITAKESDLLTNRTLRNMRNGIKHDIPVSASFTLFKHLNITPNFSYSEYWYSNYLRKQWNADSLRIEVDTVYGFKRAYQYSGGVSFTSKLYGMFAFGSWSRVQAIRHVITPSVSLSYSPDFGRERYGYYQEVQRDTLGRTERYSIFANGVFGGPGQGKSGMVNFSLGNNVEAKVTTRDSANPVRKVKIIESLNFSTSYNMLADSLRWSDIRMSGHVTLFGKLGVNFGGTFSPYAINSRGTKINIPEFRHSGKLARFTQASVSFSYSLSSKSKSGSGQSSGQNNAGNAPGTSTDGSMFGESFSTHYNMGYVDYNVPWNISLSYNFSYSKPAFVPNISQAVSFNGSVSLTPNWRIGFSSGYDIQNRKVTTSSVNFYRDLHCWEMRLTVVPFGRYRSYSFQINVKSAILQDLKVKKDESYLDNI